MSPFTRSSSVKLPLRGRAAKNEAYWQEHKGIIQCPRCKNIHTKKRWYGSEEAVARTTKTTKVTITEKKTCPACTMIKNNTFEGELFIEGFPAVLTSELEHLIKNFGDRATKTDPQDRVITVEKTRKGYRVTTTENQLANKLAKKIRDAFNTVEVNFKNSAEPSEVSRVHVSFIK